MTDSDFVWLSEYYLEVTTMTVEIPEVVESKLATSVEMEEVDPTKKTTAMFDIYLPFLIVIRPFFVHLYYIIYN